jgi:hypothetical protein
LTKTAQQDAKMRADLIYELRKSDAPRFLLSLLQLPAGLHRIIIDDPTLSKDEQVGELIVEEDETGRKAELVYVRSFPTSESLTPIYHVYVQQKDTLSVSQTIDGNAPEKPHDLFAISDLANQTSIEDFCDFCSIPMGTSLSGKAAPEPIQEEQEA